MENFKKSYLSIGHGISLSKRDCLTTPQEEERMGRISYASIVGSIMYAMNWYHELVIIHDIGNFDQQVQTNPKGILHFQSST